MCGNRRGKIAKYDGIAEVWGGGGSGGGGLGADRPKVPVEKMAKSDGLAEVQRLKNLLFRLRRKLC